MRKVAVRVAWVFGGLVVLSKLGEIVGTGGGTTTSTSDPASCPSAAAMWLPSATGAVLVGMYESDKHVVTLCQDSVGQVWYDGQVKGAAATAENHISKRATKTATGYIAENGLYRYEIDTNTMTLMVTNNGKSMSKKSITRVRP
jgi:hypothetical protein